MDELEEFQSTDHAVAELSSARPKLRPDLRFNFQESKDRPNYVLEDLTRRSYFQVGLSEYRFLLSLDGTRTIREAMANNARAMGEDALSEGQAQSLLRWAIDQELFESDSSGQDDRRQEHAADQAKKKPKRFVQEVLFLKIPLGNPEPLLRKVTPWLAWSVTPPFILLWVGTLFYAGFQLILHLRPFLASAGNAILPSNWIFLLVTFMGLKLIHELWHGIVARHFRIPVPEWGVRLLALISPLTYVDASATWRLSSRWPRICVAAAGMYVELFIAAIAVIVWINTGPGWLNTLSYNIVFAASVVTVLFNANPLMKFDGYYILSDLLHIPNLSMKGQRFVTWCAKRYLLGMKEEILPQNIRERRKAIGIYGILAAIWRILIWIGILALASTLFKGAGVVIVAAVLIASAVSNLKRLFKFLSTGSGGRRPNLVSAGLRISVLAGGIAALLILVPVSPSPKMAAVIDFPDKKVLRVECPGFVSDVLCTNGQKVESGQPLLSLKNPVKQLELDRLRLEVKLSELQSRRLLDAGMIASYQAEVENRKGLSERLVLLESFVETLEFSAPIAGRIYADRMESLPGQYMRTGDIVMVVIPDSPPELLVSISQDDLEAFRRRQSDEISFRLRGHPQPAKAQLTRTDTRANTLLPHPSLSSSAGGPLIVRQQQSFRSERKRGLAIEQPGMENQGLGLGRRSERELLARQELAAPRLLAYAQLADPNDRFWEGEWGFAKLSGGQRYRLGQWLGDKLLQFFKNQFRPGTGGG